MVWGLPLDRSESLHTSWRSRQAEQPAYLERGRPKDYVPKERLKHNSISYAAAQSTMRSEDNFTASSWRDMGLARSHSFSISMIRSVLVYTSWRCDDIKIYFYDKSDSSRQRKLYYIFVCTFFIKCTLKSMPKLSSLIWPDISQLITFCKLEAPKNFL